MQDTEIEVSVDDGNTVGESGAPGRRRSKRDLKRRKLNTEQLV